jgi:hypothetical protein
MQQSFKVTEITTRSTFVLVATAALVLPGVTYTDAATSDDSFSIMYFIQHRHGAAAASDCVVFVDCHNMENQ